MSERGNRFQAILGKLRRDLSETLYELEKAVHEEEVEEDEDIAEMRARIDALEYRVKSVEACKDDDTDNVDEQNNH